MKLSTKLLKFLLGGKHKSTSYKASDRFVYLESRLVSLKPASEVEVNFVQVVIETYRERFPLLTRVIKSRYDCRLTATLGECKIATSYQCVEHDQIFPRGLSVLDDLIKLHNYTKTA